MLTTSSISYEWDSHYPIGKNALDSSPSGWIRLTNEDDGGARVKKLIDPGDRCRVGGNYGKRNISFLKGSGCYYAGDCERHRVRTGPSTSDSLKVALPSSLGSECLFAVGLSSPSQKSWSVAGTVCIPVVFESDIPGFLEPDEVLEVEDADWSWVSLRSVGSTDERCGRLTGVRSDRPPASS